MSIFRVFDLKETTTLALGPRHTYPFSVCFNFRVFIKFSVHTYTFAIIFIWKRRLLQRRFPHVFRLYVYIFVHFYRLHVNDWIQSSRDLSNVVSYRFQKPPFRSFTCGRNGKPYLQKKVDIINFCPFLPSTYMKNLRFKTSPLWTPFTKISLFRAVSITFVRGREAWLH